MVNVDYQWLLEIVQEKRAQLCQWLEQLAVMDCEVQEEEEALIQALDEIRVE